MAEADITNANYEALARAIGEGYDNFLRAVPSDDLGRWSPRERARRWQVPLVLPVVTEMMRARDENLPWRCFHCGEVFTDPALAAEHFGDGNSEADMPICIEAATTEQRELVKTTREMWTRIRAAEEEIETLDHQLRNFEYVARKLTGKPSATTNDLTMEWDAMVGQVLAAEAAVNAAPRWLAQWLRRRAERRAILGRA